MNKNVSRYSIVDVGEEKIGYPIDAQKMFISLDVARFNTFLTKPMDFNDLL